MPDPLLSLQNLRTFFYTDAGVARAVDGVSFHIDEGETVNDPQASLYDTSWVPDDRPSKRTDYGNTLAEMRAGESLDRRLREDEPDVFERELGGPARRPRQYLRSPAPTSGVSRRRAA